MGTSLSYRELLIEEMLPWLRELTGIDLTEGVDSTCSKYEYTGEEEIISFYLSKSFN